MMNIKKRPETISEVQKFLDLAVQKGLQLLPSSFGKFTADHLPDDYLYNKWLGKGKDFADVYLNMDPTHQELFVRYVNGGETEFDHFLASLLNRFYLFCWNWDSSDFVENPFKGKNGEYLRKAASGKKDPQGISSVQVQKLFRRLDDKGRHYLTWCACGAKKEESV